MIRPERIAHVVIRVRDLECSRVSLAHWAFASTPSCQG